MLQPFNPAIAANRFGLGARPRELTVIGADGRDWLRAQLTTAPLLADAALRPSADILAQGLVLQRQIQAARRGRLANAAASDAATAAVVQKLPQYLKPIYVSEVTARLGAAVSSERPFVERLVQFWSNHFAVSVDKQYLAGLAGSFEREAIRPHVLGSFNDLLLGVETHPAMLLYLDNQQSVGPHSQVALRVQRRGGLRRIGINENLAREILELHTLGVGGGYTQADVTTFAQVITGWSIGGTGGTLPRALLRTAGLNSAPTCTSRAPSSFWVRVTRTQASARASRCCAIWHTTAPPRTSSPPSSRGISLPMSRRPR